MSIRLISQITVNLSSNNPAYLISRSDTIRCMILTVILKEFVSLPSLSSQHQLFRWWAASIFSSFQILRPHAPLSLHSTKKTTLITNDKQPVTSSLKRTRLNLYNQGEKRIVISHLLWEGMRIEDLWGKIGYNRVGGDSFPLPSPAPHCSPHRHASPHT